MYVKKIILTSLILVTQISNAHPLHGVSFFSPRPQSVNAARDIAGVHQHRDLFNAHDNTNGYINISTAYTKSLRAHRIAEALFSTDALKVSGSLVPNRFPDELLADYFGLAPTFNSLVRIEPHIQNAIVSFDAYVGLDKFVRGLHLEMHAPAVWTQSKINLCEDIINDGSNTQFPTNYMDSQAITAPINKFKNVFKGDVKFGQMQDALKFGKIDGEQSKGGVADLQLALGWNFLLRETGHVGLNLRLTAPTGSRPNSEYFFEPIIGNGKHWELGAGFNGRVLLWEKDGQQELSFHGIANIMHLFKTHQRRSFDFKENGFGSRFILLKEFDADGNYINKLTPAINQTTLNCNVHIDIRTDIVAMFGYTYNEFVFDIGYNGFIRSKEKLELCECIPDKKFGLKGIQSVIELGTPSNCTQSEATLFGNQLTNQAMVVDVASPLFIATTDLDLRSAASSRLVTHKLFTHLGYTWANKKVPPFIGVGAEIEFEGINTRNTDQAERNTLAQWGIWFKVGAAFS